MNKACVLLAVAGSALGGLIGSTGAFGADPPCVRFYEQYDFKGKESSCCTDGGHKMEWCTENDWAKSMVVYGPKGTIITIYDSPDAATGDDYFVLEKLDDDPVYVSGFETPTITGGGRTYFCSGGNSLDGKVSTFRWCDARDDDCD